MIGRRALLVAVSACAMLATAPPALAQEGFLDRIGQWLTGGSDVLAGVQTAAEKLDRSDFAEPERIAVVDEIDRLNDSIDALLVIKGGFIDHMQEYVDRSRQSTPPAPDTREEMWRRVKDDVVVLLVRVEGIQKQLRSSIQLKARLDAATRSGLNQVMLERTGSLNSFASLPAPVTAEELAAVERLAARHRTLRDRTAALQRSLFIARDRLAASPA